MKLKRPLVGGERGTDVTMVQRALNRWTSGELPLELTGRYGDPTVARMVSFQLAEIGRSPTGHLGQATLDKLAPYFDAYGRMRYRLFRPAAPKPPKPVLELVYPLPRGAGGGECQGLHRTAGDTEGGFAENWAIDFCAQAGTPVLSPEAGKVWKRSGHDPATAHPNPDGIYGWSIYVKTPDGHLYYVTHLGQRAPLAVGTRVTAGEELGLVGNQHPFTGRPNHSHVGVTSPKGAADAKRRILAVNAAPREAPL